MAKSKYVRIKGKPGVSVPNHYAMGALHPRYFGKRRDAALEGEPEHLDRYKDVEEVLLQHRDILSACADGDLELLGQCIASDAEEADKLMPSKVGLRK